MIGTARASVTLRPRVEWDGDAPDEADALRLLAEHQLPRSRTSLMPEGFEKHSLMFRGDANPSVGDADLQITQFCRFRQANVNRRIRWREFPCIGDQVADNLLGPYSVTQGRGQVRRRL